MIRALLALAACVSVALAPGATPGQGDRVALPENTLQCSPIPLNSPWSLYITACETSQDEIHIRNKTVYTVLNLEYVGEYAQVPIVDTPSIGSRAWSVVFEQFENIEPYYSNTRTLLLGPQRSVTLQSGYEFYLQTVVDATNAVYSAAAPLRYENSIELDPVGRQIPLPGILGMRQKAVECAEAAGPAFATDTRALSGSLTDMRAGLAATMSLDPCVGLFNAVKKQLSGELSTADEEAAYADEMKAYLGEQVSKRWWSKARGSLMDLAEQAAKVAR